MNKYSKPKFNESDLGVNPFTSNLVIRVNKRVFKNTYSKVNGEEKLKVADVEYDKFCKVFTDKPRREQMNALSARGKELLFWLMYQITSGKDYIWINRDMYMDELGISSENTFLTAVKDLIYHGIIGKTVVGKDVYWINPDIFFKGDRVYKFKDKLEFMNNDNKNEE